MSVADLFPFDGFRENQKIAMYEAAQHIEDGRSVILDLPTGIGKSAINVTLARMVDSAYYTTPQRELRTQLMQDDDLSPFFKTLRARRDYVCDVSEEPCDECPVYASDDSCSEYGRSCTYMRELADATVSDTVVTTMARVLIAGKQLQSTLDPRDLLIVDEVHSLDPQTASMHINIRFAPDQFESDVFDEVVERVHDPDRVFTHQELRFQITELRDRLNEFIEYHDGDPEMADQVIRAKEVMWRMGIMFDEIDFDDPDGSRTWVGRTWTEDEIHCLELKPITVGPFLRRFFWSQGDQYVLSTASVPYRDDPDRWLPQLGLDPDEFEVVSKPSPFPPENRLVHTRHEIGQMSQYEDMIWDRAMYQLDELSAKHDGQNGLVHTASYDRAQKIADEADDWDHLSGNVIADQRGTSIVDEWQQSPADVFASPALVEGIDLYGDRARWQVLLKVPYPHPSDPRVQWMIDQDRWYWYHQRAAVKILQSVGRAVRSTDDEADFYVFDASFEDVRSQVTFPDWFEEAIC